MSKACLMSCLLLSSLLFQSLSAQNSAPADKDTIKADYHFNPVVVTATRQAHAQRDLAASITLIDHDQLAMTSNGSALTAVQQLLPAFHLTEWGVMGFGVAGKAAGKLSMRGLGGSANTHVLILRNGRPDFMGLMGCTIADEFFTGGVERIEVIRGPGSFLYGTNATGGIINLLPRKRHEPGFETHVALGAGAYGSKTASVNHGGRKDQWDYYLSAGHRETDGHRPDSDYRSNEMSLHLGHGDASRFAWEANANLSDIYLLDPGPQSAPAENQWYDMFRGGGDFTARLLTRKGAWHLKLHGNGGRHRFFDGWRSKDFTAGGMLYVNWSPVTGHQSTAGLDYKQYGGTASSSDIDYGSHQITEWAPYLHVQQLLAGRYILSGGLRAEHHSIYGWEWLPKAGLVAHMTQQVSLRISHAKGFRSPSIRELYFWMPANDSLTPDRVWNSEAGLSIQPSTLFSAEIIGFLSRGSNLIQLTGPPPLWNNGGSYKLQGLEIILRCTPLRNLDLNGSFSRTVPVDSSTPILNGPESKIALAARYRRQHMDFSATLTYAHDLTGAVYPTPSPAPQYVPLDDYTLLNLAARFDLMSALSLKIMINNCLDQTYQSMAGYPMPGRHLQCSVEYGWMP